MTSSLLHNDSFKEIKHKKEMSQRIQRGGSWKKVSEESDKETSDETVRAARRGMLKNFARYYPLRISFHIPTKLTIYL